MAASTDHFAPNGAIYRRACDGVSPLDRVGGGLPQWLDGIVDTACIATLESRVALVDRAGNVYLSQDRARTWTRIADGLPTPSSVLIAS